MTEIDVQRRETLKRLVLAGTSILASSATTRAFQGRESDWEEVRAAYPKQEPFMNLNNAGVSPSTIAVQEKAIEAFRFANANPFHNLWEVLDEALPATAEKLARLADCDPLEIAINRNTTEGMCTAIFGMPLSRGDEVLLGKWDYPSMLSAWEQREQREGIVVSRVSFELTDTDDSIVAAFEKAMTPRTRAIQLTHMIHWSGRVLPVERICRIAGERGILSVVDAAQSFAHIPVSFRKMGCDYLATSLHKWLCAPFGTGMLIVKSSRRDRTWPLLGTFEPLEGAGKFGKSNLGTYDSAAQFAIGPAVDFHDRIGTERVHHRLRELSRYWVERATDIRGFRVHTPMESPLLGAVTLFSIEGIASESIVQRLRREHRIGTALRNWAGLSGIRVSPHVYTSKPDLDEFVRALREVARSA